MPTREVTWRGCDGQTNGEDRQAEERHQTGTEIEEIEGDVGGMTVETGKSKERGEE